MNQGKKWVQSAGATVVSDGEVDATGVEVSPLMSYVSIQATPPGGMTDGSSGRGRSRVSQGTHDQGTGSNRETRVSVQLHLGIVYDF